MLGGFALATVLFIVGAVVFSNRIYAARMHGDKQGYAVWCGLCVILAVICGCLTIGLFVHAALT